MPPLGGQRDEPTRSFRASDLAIQRPAPVDVEPTKRAIGEARRLRKGRLAIRKFDPVSVFRFSIVFQFCSMLIFLLATGLIYGVLRLVGVISSLEGFLTEMFSSDFQIDGGKIIIYGFIAGCIWTVASSVVMTFGAFMYNLIADVVGGIEMIVVERDDP